MDAGFSRFGIFLLEMNKITAFFTKFAEIIFQTYGFLDIDKV